MKDSHKIALIDNKKSITDSIEKRLNTKFRVIKVKRGEIYKLEDSIQLIISGCDFKCRIENCMSNFMFFIENKNIPFVIIRPFLIADTYKVHDIYEMSCLNSHNISSLHTKVVESMKHIFEYDQLLRTHYHPTDPVYKTLIIQKYLFENPQEKESLTSLASMVDFSPSWLSFKFKEIAGVSLKNFLLTIKTCKGFWDLLLSEKLVKTIAFELGYKPLTFTKLIYSIFGVLPTDLRKNIHKYIKK